MRRSSSLHIRTPWGGPHLSGTLVCIPTVPVLVFLFSKNVYAPPPGKDRSPSPTERNIPQTLNLFLIFVPSQGKNYEPVAPHPSLIARHCALRERDSPSRTLHFVIVPYLKVYLFLILLIRLLQITYFSFSSFTFSFFLTSHILAPSVYRSLPWDVEPTYRHHSWSPTALVLVSTVPISGRGWKW